MSEPRPVRRTFASHLSLRCAPVLVVLSLITYDPAAQARPTWPTIAPEELAERTPRLDPTAAAEALEWKIEIDDTRDTVAVGVSYEGALRSANLVFESLRHRTEYVRYKIYSPEDAEEITRVMRLGRGGVHARVTLPNGSVREYGPDELKERTLARRANRANLLGRLTSEDDDRKESFFAVPGIEPGCILEYHSTAASLGRILSPIRLQREGVPVRRVQLTWKAVRTGKFRPHLFVLNRINGETVNDPKNFALTFTARDIPALEEEPLVGPMSDYVMTLMAGYELMQDSLVSRSHKVPAPGRIKAELGPWATFSTKMNWYERDRGFITPRVRKLASDLTAGAASDEAKARAVHAHVTTEYQAFLRRTIKKRALTNSPQSLDELLEWRTRPELTVGDNEFLWLAIALYQAAGLEAHTLMLPDRRMMRFKPEFVLSAFLPYNAVAIKSGDTWMFSAPENEAALPFGMLPWQHQGHSGLLALDHQQQFINVPPSPPQQSVMRTAGQFALDGSGTLTGSCSHSATGHAAVRLRERLLNTDPSLRDRLARHEFGIDTDLVTLSDFQYLGLDDPEAPLVVKARMHWPGFASRVGDRLVITTGVFRTEDRPPFTTGKRKYPISFRYRWEETDEITITIPDGFAPESPSMPTPNVGDVLSHKVEMGYDASRRVLHIRRHFSCDAVEFPARLYTPVKRWFEGVTHADRHPVVFRKSPRLATPAKATSAVPVTSSTTVVNQP